MKKNKLRREETTINVDENMMKRITAPVRWTEYINRLLNVNDGKARMYAVVGVNV